MKAQLIRDEHGSAIECVRKKPHPLRNWIILGLAILFYVSFSQIMIPGLTPNGQKAFAYAIVIIALLIFEVFPIAVISILAVVLAPVLGIVSQADAFANFAIGPLFFVFGVLIIAVAFTSTGFGYRMSLYVSGLLGAKPNQVLLSYMLGTGLISSILADIPTAFIFGSLAAELLRKNNCLPGCSNFGKAIMIGIPIAATVGGIGTPAGGALNVMTISMLQNLADINITFLQWTIICFPFAIIMLLICWGILCKVYPAEIELVAGLDDIVQKKKELGALTLQEKKYLVIFSLMIILWVTQSFHGLSLWVVAVAGAALLFMPGIDILDWRVMGSQISCEVPYLIGGTNVVAFILTSNGAAAWLAQNTVGALDTTSVILILTITVALGVYGHYIIPAATALLAVLTPVVCMLGVQFGISPMMMALALCLAAHVTTLLPFADPVSLATYEHDYWNIWDMIKPSLIYGTIWIPFTVIYLYIFQALGFFA